MEAASKSPPFLSLKNAGKCKGEVFTMKKIALVDEKERKREEEYKRLNKKMLPLASQPFKRIHLSDGLLAENRTEWKMLRGMCNT